MVVKPKKSAKRRPHYVNNKDLFAAMVEYRNGVLAAKAADTEVPRVPPFVGECIMKIATHLSFAPNFSRYTFRDDMIADGIENCLQYINNFDPAKSSNPFSYFTQIIYFAFVRRIKKEKKYLYVKYAATQRANIMDETSQLHESQIGQGVRYNDEVQYSEWSQEHMETFMHDFEESRRKKKKKKISKKAVASPDNDTAHVVASIISTIEGGK